MTTRTKRGIAVLASAMVALSGVIVTGTPSTAAAMELPVDEISWSYLDDGSDPAEGLDNPDAWAAPEFDDSDWSDATGTFGARGGELRELSGGFLPDNLLNQYTDGENNPAFFFRTEVDVPANYLGMFEQVHVDVRYDDAASVFVNGTYVGGGHDGDLMADANRNNVYGGSNASAPILQTVSFSTDLLVEGTNVLAVRVNNGRAGSSDVYFGIERVELDESGPLEFRYWDADDVPSEPLAWAQPDFDDSGWKTAEGSFGALRGDWGTVSGGFAFDNLLRQYYEDTTTNLETHFFRADVEVTEDELSEEVYSLIANIYYDDAVSLYVNGTYVGGGHDDAFQSMENPDRSYGGSNQGSPNLAEVHIPADLLEVGSNTFAFRLHQERATSSDSYFEFVGLVTNYDAPPAFHNVVLGAGADETERRLSWYTDQALSEGSVVELARTADIVEGTWPTDAVRVLPESSNSVMFGSVVHHATLSGLEPETDYTYRLGNDEEWLATYEFATSAAGDFQFFYYGDAQIGSSGNIPRDGQGWQDTLDVMTEQFPDIDLLVSAGDQVEIAGNENEYLAYTAPQQMKELSHVPTVGNHDVGAPQTYREHFNIPNYDADDTRNHWYGYNGVLFMHLNTEHRNYPNHRAWMKNVIDSVGDDYHQHIVVLHRSLYSVANHSNSDTTKGIREGLAPIFAELDIEIVLAGHDHSYARTHVISDFSRGADTTVENPTDVRSSGQPDEVTVKRGEMVGITANSSSGSKYYTPQVEQDGRYYEYLSVYNQERVPNYTVATVNECSVKFDTYRATDNTVVDSVKVNTLRAVPELVVPESTFLSQDELDDFDPMDGVSASDPCEDVVVEVDGQVGTEQGVYTLTYSVTDGYPNTVTAQQLVVVTESAQQPDPDPGEPTDPLANIPVDRLYVTPGFHNVNDRWWNTRCEPYSQTIRCTTEIWGTKVSYEGGRFVASNEWVFNNLTYLPYMERSEWAGNPLAETGEFTSNGRQWRTECDTATTGEDACRSWIHVNNMVQATQNPDGGWRYYLDDVWQFNNMVLFKSS